MPTRDRFQRPQRRRDSVRIPNDVARRVRDGHPWIFAEALHGRGFPADALGQAVDVVDAEGHFVARALVEPDGRPVLRVFSYVAGQVIDGRYLDERLAACLAWRRRSFDLAPESCFRLLNAENEGLPGVSIDCFGRYLVISYATPLAERIHEQLLASLERLLKPAAVYLQRRYHPPSAGEPRPGAELVLGEPAPPEIVVTEDRTRYVVDVTAPGNPGLFLDMRAGRRLLARLAAGARVLNCFSYTGAFSLVAALHGAREVVSVDGSGRAHSRARRNFSENNLEAGNAAWEFVVGDAAATMARLQERKRRFEIIVLDPPTFSTTKGRTFTALKDYAELVEAALGVAEQGAMLLACCNAAKLPAEELDRAIGRGAAAAGRQTVIVERLGLPADFPVRPAFPEGSYLKILLARIDEAPARG